MKERLLHAAASLRDALSSASRGLVDRETLVELVALAAVAGEHVLVIGPPGTAKSEAVRRVARATGGYYFEYLLGRFTEPSEIFGPVDLRKLKEGVVETEITGMLPEAEIAFLDEIFQGSTAILNTLLGILNERTFRRGHTRITCPLRICVGASNALPEDESLAAFADRFLVRVFVDPIPDMLLEDLLEGGWSVASSGLSHRATIEDVDLLADAARAADLARVRPLLARAVRMLRSAGVALSDRRIVKVQRLVAAAAALAGRAEPTGADLWPIVFAVPTREQQTMARDAARAARSEREHGACGGGRGGVRGTARSRDASVHLRARAARTEARRRRRRSARRVASEARGHRARDRRRIHGGPASARPCRCAAAHRGRARRCGVVTNEQSVDVLATGITWRLRATPLAPAGVAATGAVAVALGRRLLDASDEALSALLDVAGRGVLVVLGESDALPWVDGVVYLGMDSRARSLLLPTTLEPAEPLELVERAIAARFAGVSRMAVLPQQGIVVPVASARRIARDALERWLAEET